MLKLIEKLAEEKEVLLDTALASVCLGIDDRVRSRLKVQLDDGREAGLFLPRGELLRGGDVLRAECGECVRVVAAPEKVSTAVSQDQLELTRAAYHLGNRHVPLQVAMGWLRYQHDHVLDDMLRQMGLSVRVSMTAFEPEAGAYQQQGDGHNHAHHHHHSS